MRKGALHAILALAAAVSGCQRLPHARPEPRVMAHYMPWFKAEPDGHGGTAWDHWQWFGKGPKHDPDDVDAAGRRDIASVFYPLIGPYNGVDDAVLAYHVRTAEAVGIEGFIADWYGPGTYTDRVFSNLLRVAEAEQFRAAICLEEKTFFPGYLDANTREDALHEMERQIRHVLRSYAPSPAYYRHHGLPVLFIFNNFGEGALGKLVLTPDEVRRVLACLPEPVLLVRGDADESYWGAARGAYAWVGDGAYRRDFYEKSARAREDGRLALRVGVANPGFDDRGVWGWGKGPRQTDRRGTAEYEEQWREAISNQVDLVQIATWNDFGEGTTIEPAMEYGFTFLDLTEKFVGDLTGRRVDLGDNQLPLQSYQGQHAESHP